MKKVLLNLLICLFCATMGLNIAKAQVSLTLDDVLPPYKFTAGLLKNGHFYITTKYIGDTTNQLIYVGAKDPVMPPNYTSHIHIKIDGTVFLMPFEDDPNSQMPPPANQLVIESLFRDSLNGMPRINARIYAITQPAKDTVRFIYSLMPVKRPSGGFIRLSLAFDTARQNHLIGTLLLIDTKIGNNDQAPIVTSLGYFNNEKEFTKSSSPAIPEFWLGLEGTPRNPMLTARGNLQASDLITPDYFMFGNWKDYSAMGNIKGLNSFEWKDRPANDNLTYTDSAVLLVWDEQNLNSNNKKIIASTEIGIVDSLTVIDAYGSTGGSGGSGIGDGVFYARAGRM